MGVPIVLFDVPEEHTKRVEKDNANKKETKSKVKLKKGETLDTLIDAARKIVEEKLGNYKETSSCVIDKNELINFFNEIEDNSIVAIDTETTGLDTLMDRLVGISVCNGKHCLYIPVNHITAYGNSFQDSRLSIQLDIEVIKSIFGDVFKNRKFRWVYHNAKFDLAVLRTFFGYALPDPYWDTMLASQLLYQDEEHSLKFQYNKYIAEEDEGVNRFDTLFKGITFDYVPLDVATIYAGKDAFMTLALYEYQNKILNQSDYQGVKYVFDNIEMPLLPILEDMQRLGVNMNDGMLKELYDKYSERLKLAEVEVFNELNKYSEQIEEYKSKHYNHKLTDPINLSSPIQLSTLFYEILGYKTKSMKGTGVSDLMEIKTPLTNALLEYRKMEKLIDAFLVALPKQLSKYDNKIHTSLNQYGAATGRFSSSGPNLQQIPSRGDAKEIRRIFGASKGNILMSSDFSQQEPKFWAA